VAQAKKLPEVGQRIQSIRERLGMTQEAVAERLGIPRSAVSDIENGKRELSATELFTLAQMFGEPMEHLLGIGDFEADDELVMLRAQTVTAGTKAELNRFVHLCREYAWLEEATGERREPDLRPVRGTLSTWAQAWRLADEERKRLGLGVTPAHELIPALEERAGVKILFLPLNADLSGASLWSKDFGPAVLVNKNHVPGRRAFTTAHEYFHLLTEGRVASSKGPERLHVCSSEGPDGKKDSADKLADQFAAHLLLPPEHFVEQIRALQNEKGKIDPFDLNRVGQYFGVSTQAVLVQMAARGMMSWNQYKKIYTDPAFKERLLRDRGREIGKEPQRFRDLAMKAYLMERVSRERLAELLGINVAEVSEVLENYGGVKGMRDGVRLTLPH